MADTSLTPNMNLVVPTVGQDPGPDWANNINADLGILDQHNHSNGQGVPITPAGLNINTDLPMNSNNLTLVNTVRFNNLTTSLAGASPNLGCIYEAVNNLYFNDGVGNVIQLTKAGSVNSTSSGISSGTATASFVGSVLVVDSDVNTPANIQAGSIEIGNNISGSNFAQLQAPSALGANYSLTLPPTNSSGGTVFLTYDSSNNEGIGPAVTGGIGQSNLAPRPVSTGPISIGGVGISASCGSFTSTTGFVPVTNLTMTITTSGRPVFIALQPDGTGSGSHVEASPGTIGAGGGSMAVFRGATAISNSLEFFSNSTTSVTNYPVPGFLILDTPAAGTYTYTVQLAANFGGQDIGITNSVMVVYEI